MMIDCETLSPEKPTRPRRGIQPGQVAWSQSSKKLHGNTEDITKLVVERWQKIDPNIIWQRKLSKYEIISMSNLQVDPETFQLTGVAPDGGVVLYRHRDRGVIPLFSIECKEQQNAGNAIERWFKNFTALKVVNPRMAYVTFCTGAGAAPDGVIPRTLNHSLLEYATACREYRPRRWNKLYYEGPSLFRNVKGTSAARIELIVEHLMAQKLSDVSRR